MFTYSEFTHHYTKSSFPCVIPTSKDYKVFVNGEEVPVYTCRISAYPFNCIWPDHQRPVNQTEKASFVNLISDEAIKLEVVPTAPFEDVKIKPYSKEVKHDTSDGRIKFALSENGQYVLQLGSYHRTLYIFNSKPIEKPKKEDVTYYFGADVHFPWKITLKDNESVYVDKDAYVYGCIYAENAKNIKVYGNGIFDDGIEERVSINCYEEYINGNIKFYDCENVKVQGVGFVNSANWCVNLFHCKAVELDNIKVFGQWRYNTDGIDIVNSQNILVKNSFVHSFDDTVVIKGIERYCKTNNTDIKTENCVLWCDWGHVCELGLETMCEEYSNITYKNCDVLRGGNVVLNVNNGNYAYIHDVLFENIRVEYEKSYTLEVYQRSDDMLYECKDVPARTVLFRIGNVQYNSEEWGIKAPPLSLFGEKAATAHNITARNIKVYYDKDLPITNGKYVIPIVIKSITDEKEHSDIKLENITVNGTRLTMENAMLDIRNVKNFELK